MTELEKQILNAFLAAIPVDLIVKAILERHSLDVVKATLEAEYRAADAAADIAEAKKFA